MNSKINKYHSIRLSHDRKREILWKTLVDFYFCKHVNIGDSILEIGCGYSDFINNIKARVKHAVDIWPGAENYLHKDVSFYKCSAEEISSIQLEDLDVVFASNVFEHLSIKEFSSCLKGLHASMKEGARLIILQPNYRFAYKEYFDDYTHVSVWSDKSLSDFLNVHGFSPVLTESRFLPLTIKSRLPTLPFLIKAYIMSPWKPMGKQMLIISKRISDE